MTRTQVKAVGGPSKPPKIRKRRWKNKRTGKTEWVPEGLDPGWDYNPGRVRMQNLTDTLAGKLRDAAPDLAAAAQGRIPLLTEDVVAARQLEAAKGSNPGGLFEGSDGVRRYVKHYDDPAQGYSEAVAGIAYRELGLTAPEGALFVRGGEKLSLATRYLENDGTLGKAGLTKARAERILDGYVADVWLANWDVLGADLDNMVVTGRGLARIDNGGALLFRAKAGRKAEDRLKQLAEWDGFTNSSRNPSYAKVFNAAGLNSADELGRNALTQIKAIEELGKRTRDFEDLLPLVAGVPPADREAILRLLRNRAKLLSKEIASRVREFLKAPAYERGFRALVGARFSTLLDGALQRIRRAGGGRRSLRDAELASMHGYTGNDYSTLNRPLRGGSSSAALKQYRPYIETVEAGLARLPSHQGVVRRGTELPATELAKHQPGQVVTYAGFTSTSLGEGFSGPHKAEILSRTGKHIEFLSAYPGEREVLFPPGTRFRVLERIDKGRNVFLRMEEVE